MQHDEAGAQVDEAEVRREYAERRRKHRLLLCVQVGLLLVVVLALDAFATTVGTFVDDTVSGRSRSVGSEAELLGVPAQWVAFVAVALMLTAALASWVAWRCPRCGHGFRRAWSPRFCARCGVKLTD